MLGEGQRITGQLSVREREVARLYAEGRNYKEIARALALSPATVRTHLNSIFRKLEVTSKVELLRKIETRGQRAASGTQGQPALGQNVAIRTPRIAGLLESLGLARYLSAFQANDITMRFCPR